MASMSRTGAVDHQTGNAARPGRFGQDLSPGAGHM